MHIIFLAAGRGLRMGSLAATLPKALVPLSDGSTILGTNLRNLAAGVPAARAVVVGGHCWDEIRTYCERSAPHSVIATLNRRYAEAGPFMSVEVGLDAVPCDEETVAIANGDTIFSSAIFAAIAAAGAGIGLAVSEDGAILPDDMGVTLDRFGNVVKAQKSESPLRSGLVSAGILSVRGSAAADAFRLALASVRRKEESNGTYRPWHDVLRHLHDSGVPVRSIRVDRSGWREFDHQECISRFAGTGDDGLSDPPPIGPQAG